MKDAFAQLALLLVILALLFGIAVSIAQWVLTDLDLSSALTTQGTPVCHYAGCLRSLVW